MTRRALLLAVLLLALPARATTVRPLTLRETVARATSIVRARVADARPRWRERAIVTDVVLADVRALAGEPVERLTLFGGALDGLVMTLAGQPVLAKGDDVLLLLDRDAERCPFVGVWHGVFHVHDGQTFRSSPGGDRPVIDQVDDRIVLGRPHERGVSPEALERWIVEARR
jgi:hypothetical protein